MCFRPTAIVLFAAGVGSGCLGSLSELPDASNFVASADSGSSADASTGDAFVSDAAVTVTPDAAVRDASTIYLDSWDAGPTVPVLGFGDGGAVGSFSADADVWVPGRNQAGHINQASWDLVPRLRWVTVAGTKIEALTPEIEALVPGWSSYTPNLNWNNWTDSWSGIIADPEGARLWLFGGGHSNGSNNGLYRFDAYSMRWSVEGLPSDPATWSSAYKRVAGGNSTGYPEAAANYNSAVEAGTLRAVDDWYYDQSPFDNKPTARHTYSGLVFDKAHNELVMMSRRMWRFDLTARRWSQRRLYFDDLTSGYMDGEGLLAFYDEVKTLLVATSNGSTYGGNGRYVSFNRATEAWVSGSSVGGGSPWQRLASTDARWGRNIAFIQPPVAQTHDGYFMLHNLDTGTVISSGNDFGTGVGFEYGEGLTQAMFSRRDSYYDGTGLVYVPTLNRYWMHTLMGDGAMRWLEIDPTTTPKWTLRTINFVGAVPDIQRYGKRRATYLPSLNAVVCLSASGKDMSVFRF